MRRNNFCAILSILIIILSITGHSSQSGFTSAQNHINKTDYTISFDISGDFTIIGTAKYIVSGSVSIDATYDLASNFWSYSIKYSASIPSANLAGNTVIKENNTDKKLLYPNIEIGIIGIIWNSFSNNSQNDVYSIFRITEAEIKNGEFQLLNYSATNIDDFNLFSPKLSKSLKTYRIRFQPSSEQKSSLFFDVTHLRLAGFDLKSSQTLNDDNYRLAVQGVVSEVSYSLTRANLDKVFIIINSLISGSIIILVIFVIWSKYRNVNKIVVKGGLSDER